MDYCLALTLIQPLHNAVQKVSEPENVFKNRTCVNRNKCVENISTKITFAGFPEILELVVLHSETNFRPKWEVWKHYALLTFRELMGIRAYGNLE